MEATVKGQSHSDSLLLSPCHWAKLFRGVVAIVAVPVRFRGLCGPNPCISVGFLDDHIIYFLFAEVVPAYLAYMGEMSLWSFLLHTSVGWEGRSFSLFDGSGWSRGAVAQGVPHFMLWSMMVLGPAFDNSWIRGRSGGRSGGRSVVFSALVFICVLCLFLLLSSSLSFPHTVISSLFIVSFVHSVLLLLKSNHSGRMMFCNAK